MMTRFVRSVFLLLLLSAVGAMAFAQNTISLVSGNSQSNTISTALAAPFVVKVTDAGSLPVSGISVTFAIASTPVGATGQSLSLVTDTTGVNGELSSTLTLGNKVGTYTVTATSAGATGSPVTFTATATVGAATNIALTSGNGQSNVISTALGAPFVVTVTDAGGNPVSGTSVTFAIASTPVGATGQSLSILNATTIANGQASSTLTLGNKVGTYTVTATSAGLTGSPVTFTATATVGAATNIALTSGNGQSNVISTALGAPFVVTVTDAGGNPVSGTSVTFAIASTPVGATGQSLSILNATTIANGQANSTLTLGNKVGTYTVTATSAGLTGSPVTFTSTATVGVATNIALTSGNSQSGTISTALGAPFVVTVTDAGGNPVSGTSVTFAIASTPVGATGQSLSILNATTIANGQANSTLTLGNKVGTYTVTATSAGLTGSPVTFTATATVGTATNIALTSGNSQSGTISTALAAPFVVTVTDAGGNPISGRSVTFAIASTPVGAAGQSLSILNATTIANGQASSTLTLGDKVGTYTVTATSAGLTGSPVTFTATASAGGATTIALTSGNSQSNVISTALAAPFVVTVTDAGGNPVSGTSVTFAIASTPVGATGQSLSILNATTIANGQASSTLTLGNKVGTYTVTATSAGLTGSPVTFTSTATVGPATNIALTSGNSQSNVISTALAAPFVVTVTDAGGNPISGRSVTFAIASTPVGAAGQSLSILNATTIANGQASSTLTLGNKVGSYTVTATSAGLTGSPVTFTATATVGTATNIALTSGNSQSDTISNVLALPFVVTVTDAGGNPVAGRSVTFAIASTPVGAAGQSLSTLNATTIANGEASSTLTLGNKVGTYTVTATSAGLTGSPVTFTSTATVGVATNIALTSGNSQSGTISTALAAPFVVTVTDAGGNPILGRSVTFAIASTPVGAAGQALSVVNATTIANGQASSTLTLGDKVGTYTVTATSAGLTGSPVTFTATASAGGATTIALTSGNSQSGTISTALALPFVVTVTDAGGNPVAGRSVTFAIASTPVGATGQSLSILNATTIANGEASSTLTLGNKVGTYTVTATSAGLTGSPVTFTATATVGVATNIALTSGNSQSGTISTALAAPFVVTVTDAGGNPITGRSVTFAIASTPVGAAGQALSVVNATTIANGQASSTLTLGDKVGTYTVTATSAGLTGSPVTFTATATAGAASNIALTSGNNQSGAANSVLVAPFVVTVTDAGGNPVAGRSVTFAIASTPVGATGQSLSILNATTIANGQTSSTLTLGNRSGTYTVTATSAGLIGSPITFTATATVGAASRLRITTEPSTPDTAGTPFRTQPVVNIEDTNGNLVTTDNSTVVTATRLTGTGTLQGVLTATAVNGIATFSNLSYNLAETITIRFTSAPVLTPDTSISVVVRPAQAARLTVQTQPSPAATAGVVFAPQPVVRVEDTFGNLITTDNASVVTAARGAGLGTLQGTLTATASAGVATFTSLSHQVANTITVNFTSGTLTAATSNNVVVSPAAASRLTIQTQPPATAVAGVAFAPQPAIRIEDAFGNLRSTDNATVVTASRNSGSGTLLGTLTATASAGVATYTNLAYTQADTLTIRFASGVLTAAVSNPVAMSAGVLNNFLVEASAGGVIGAQTAGTPFTVRITARDVNNNTVTGFTGTVNISSTGTLGLGGGATAAFTNGTLASHSVMITNTGNFTITATKSPAGPEAGTSNAFTVGPGALASFLVEASGAGGAIPTQTAGTPFTIRISAKDANNNTVTSFVGAVTLTSASGGLVGAPLTTGAFTAGVLASQSVTLTIAGVNRTITATRSGGVETGTSNAFLLNPGAASQVRVETLLDGTGTVLAKQTVSSGTSITVYSIRRDALGNFIDNGAATTWSLQVISGGVVQSDLIASPDRRSAVFTGRLVGRAKIVAAIAGLTSVTSDTLTVVVAGNPSVIQVESAADGTGIIVPAQNVVSGTTITVYAIARDIAGNFVRNAAASWGIQSETGGVLASDLVPVAPGRSARFTGHLAGTVQLSADSGGLGAVASGTLTVVSGSPRTVSATAGTPQSAPVGTAFAAVLAATVRDSSGNPVRAISVTFRAPGSGASGSFGAGPNPATTDSNGVARSPVFTANSVGGTYSDTARVAGIAVPALFVLTNTAGTPASITATAGTPQSAQVTTIFSTNLAATVRDGFGNPVRNAVVTFTAPGAGATGSFEGASTATTDSSGVAVGTPFRAGSTAGTYTVNATVAGVATPARFTLTNTPGAVAGVIATAGTPQSAQVRTPFSIRLGATVRDLISNPVSNALVTFTAPASGASGSFARGLVDTVRTDSNGVATASVFTANAIAGSYLVTATVPTGGSPATYSLTNTAGSLARFTLEATSGGPIGTQVVAVPFAITITARDSNNNAVTTFTGSVNITSTGPLSEGGGTTGLFQGGSFTPGLVFSRSGNFTLTATRTGGTETGTSNVIAVNNPVPSVTGIAPPGGRRGQTLDVVITGTGFISGVTDVTFGTRITTLQITVNGPTQLTANVRIDSNAVEGPRNVVVFNAPPGGGSATGSLVFTVGNNPVPTLTSIAPASGNRLRTLNVILRGSNFIQGVSTVDMGVGIVINTTTVDSLTQLTTNITIQAAAPTGAHTITVVNSGPGGGTASLPNAFTVNNPSPTLGTLTPSSGLRLQTMDVSLGGTEFVTGVTTVNFGDTAIVVNSVTIGNPLGLTANITIKPVALTGARTITVTNPLPGGGSASLPNAFTVANPVPVLTTIQPATAARFQTVNVVFRGSNFIRGVSTLIFPPGIVQNLVTVDSATQITANITIGGTTAVGPTFASVSNAAPGGGTSFSQAFTVTNSPYPATFTLNDTVFFATRPSPKDYTPAEYKMIGLPGASNAPVAAFIPGTYGTDWRMFWDNGASSNYFVEYDGGAGFTFSLGRAFWLIQKGPWIVKGIVPSVPLDSTGAVAIPLHANWNLITNPYTIPIPWTQVLAANVGYSEKLWAWNGGTAFAESATLQPYVGYYAFNTPNLSSLKIPYVQTGGVPKISGPGDQGGWEIALELRAGGYAEKTTTLGVAQAANRGYDPLDYRKPRAFGSVPTAYFKHPEWDPAFSAFASDIRPEIRDVEVWNVEVLAPRKASSELVFSGVANVPREFDVFLIDEARARYFDLRTNARYEFTPVIDTMRFSVVVGKPDAVKSQLESVAPKEFSLGFNFPNPFNPSTTLPVTIPFTAEVNLAVYNVLGQEVRNLHRGALEPGRYWFTWDGRGETGNSLASGVYIARLSTNIGSNFTRKMILLK